MIQIVFVKWGTKYSAAYVNAQVDAIRRYSSCEIRFICYTERPEGLSDAVEARPFVDQGFDLSHLTARGGSLPKLGIFKRGELEEGVETLYLDLDTAVFGDVARLTDSLKRRRGLYMLSRHAVPHWRVRRFSRLFRPDHYYLGNTAIMAFYPEDWYAIFDRFMAEYPRYVADPDSLDAGTRRLYDEGNERIISSTARDASRVFPRSVATKFTQEYMAPWLWLAELKNRLPWVRARRAQQPVVTFHGEPLKPVHLANAREGDIMTFKFHKTRWHYDRIGNFWRAALARDQAPGRPAGE